MRLLNVALWLLFALPLAGCTRPEADPPPTGALERPPAESDAPLVVEAEVLLASAVPDPAAVPYSECLTYIQYRVLSVEKGEYGEPELLAVHWGMRDGVLLPAARYRPGERHRLELEPFAEHPDLARVMQADDTGEYELTPYFARE